jgi:nucleotide-binding universal stress UspA family protein
MKTTSIEPPPQAAQTVQPLSEQSLPISSGVAKANRSACQIRKILVPIDLSEQSIVALRYAVSFAGQIGARITLLHVIEPLISYQDMAYIGGVSPDRIISLTEQIIARICEQEKVKPVLIRQIKVESGVPCEKIIETAKAQKADLIILATHGRTGLAHILLGSTAEKVVRLASCPVFVVRAQPPDLTPK